VGLPAWVIIGAVLIAGALGTSLVVGLQYARGAIYESEEWHAGGCLHRLSSAEQDDPSSFIVTGCNTGGADVRIVQMLRGTSARPADCPASTDEVARSGDDATTAACVRRLKDDHPGDAGKGGGVVRAGDCWSETGPGEVACAGGAWTAKVVGRAAQKDQCPAGRTFDVGRLPEPSARPVLCFGRGGRVLGTGDCVRDPHLPGARDARTGVPRTSPCGGARAWGRITGVADSVTGCKDTGANALVKVRLAYKRMLCVRRR
jgi:hypothetical protein